jgi:hypothetical protein
MADRLLSLLEPDHLGQPARVIAWAIGGLVGSVAAAAGLVVLLGQHIG